MHRARVLFLLVLSVLMPVSSPGAERPTQEITFGGSSYYPPFHYQLKNGEVTGLDAAIFEAIAELAGWYPSFQLGDWDTIQSELSAGSIDLVPMFMSEERRNRYLFTDPISIEFHLLFGPENGISYRSLDGLSGVTVAAESGAYALNQLRRMGSEAKIVGAGSETEALRLVATGQADLALIPSSVGRYTIEKEKLGNIVALSPPLLPVAYAFAINPHKPELLEDFNNALGVLQSNGEIQKLRSEWLQPSNSFGSGYFLWLVVILVVVSVLAILGAWRYRHRLNQFKLALGTSESRLQFAEKQAIALAGNDVLTEFPHRLQFLSLMEEALAEAKGKGNIVAIGVLVFRDLEFIQHTAGDSVAEEIIRKVSVHLRKSHVGKMGYLGQGKFSFLLDDLEDIDQGVGLTRLLINSSSFDYEIKGVLLRLQISAGLVFFPRYDCDAGELLRKAKLALKQGQTSSNEISIYSPSMEPDPGTIILLSDLKTALHSEGLSWAFQPQYGVGERSIIGAEMLVRWQHPRHGWIPPDKFIPLAEQAGLINPITLFAIRHAVETLRHWQAVEKHLRISINISTRDLGDRESIKELINLVEDYGRYLTLEITETAIMEDVEAVLHNLDFIKAAGINIALDDYGTGYSSLAYLKEFNFDEIKIDKKFIKNICRSKRDLMLTEASIRLAHDLGASVVAEGVEDFESADLLVGLGCDYLQGYAISKPLFIEEYLHFMEGAPVVVILPRK